MTAVHQGDLQQLERVDGAARIVLTRRAGRAAIADLYQRAPCRVLFPEAEPDDPFVAALLTTSGGLTGGDRLGIDVEIQADTAATLTTQAAEKIYRSTGDRCDISIRLDVAAGAWAEWLMQETILFDGSRLSRSIDADVAPSGRLLAIESLVFGRAAMGEAYARGYLRDRWHIRRSGRPVWTDALKLEGDVAAQCAMPFGLGRAAGYATLVYVGEDASRWLDSARVAISTSGAEGAATSFDGLLIARLLSQDAARLRAAVAHCVKKLRSEIAGLPSRMPRLWSI